ncbi:DNA polymerase III subunit gamma/tau [Candidatus Saccharibacteria bacterium]|nr:DNA polymerase III subunit gamma/tau [Candidatus Saccharibacteria bacterium]
MGRALYRKYRSKKLSEIIGQEHVTDILEAAIKQDRISHAYLFTGPRGVGKTSVARILAHEINGLPYSDEDSYLDIIEIDAASNNGVDDIRALRERVQIAPTSAKKKVYIIDEVHMLSKPAFNALLKTLEEPPEHIVFILATTDAHKLPATIISRSQQFVFRLIPTDKVAAHLKYIADQEGIKITDEALELIAKKGGGSLRDSISLLDQISSMNDKRAKITLEMVEKSLGLASDDAVKQILEAAKNYSIDDVVKSINRLSEIGVRAETIAEQLISYVLANISNNPANLVLLDKLTDVVRSSHPEVKLLTSLTADFGTENLQPRSNPKILKQVQDDDGGIVQDNNVAGQDDDRASQSNDKVSQDDDRASQSNDKVSQDDDRASQTDGKVDPMKESKPKTTEPPKKPKLTNVKLDWNKMLEDIKQEHMSYYTLLTKCTHEMIDGGLTIYARTAFNKKRFESTTFRDLLHKALTKQGVEDVAVTVKAEAPKPKDAMTAAIADIMGGGEEIDVDD